MKITLVLDNKPKLESEDYQVIDLMDLDAIQDASCLDIRMEDVLDKIEYAAREKVLKVAISKMRYGASIFIEGLDYCVVSRNIVLGKYRSEEVNSLYKNKKSLSYMVEMIHLLENNGLKPEMVSYNNYEGDEANQPIYCIKAYRPNV